MEKRLRGENLADRCRERRPPGLGADAPDLLEDVEQAIGGGVRAQVHVERRDETRGEVVLRRADGDARCDVRDRLVADELVDDVRRLPELVDGEPGVVAQPLQRLCDGLAGHAVERERERIDGGCDEVRARVDGGERRCEPDARRALDVEAHREPARLPDPRHEVLRPVRDERARRVVHEDPRRAELGQLPRPLDQRVGLAGAARAVHEPGVEGAAGTRDRGARLAQVRDVVERVVETKDVDAVLRRARDEAAHDVAADGPRADEEATAQGDSERSRDAALDRADPLPRALDATAHGGVEHTAARDLQAGEPGSVEDLGDAQHLGRRQLARERLLREQPDGGVDELRHGSGP